jgi:hypothetical protein
MHGAIERTALATRHVLRASRSLASGAESVDVWQADVNGVPIYLLENALLRPPNVYGFDDDKEPFSSTAMLLACAPHLDSNPMIHAQDWHRLVLTRLAADPAHPWAPPVASTPSQPGITGNSTTVSRRVRHTEPS